MGFERAIATTAGVAASRRQLMGWLAGGAAAATLSSPARALWQATERFPALRAYINDYVSSRRLPGAVAAIGLGEAPLMAVAAGTIASDSTAAADLDSLWRIYSQTKPITGMAAMILVDEGKLTLDTPISEALPKFADMRVLARPDAPLDETVALTTPITLRHLLTHTAGLGYGLTNRSPIELAWQERGIVPGQVSKLPIPGVRSGRTLGPLAVWADAVAEMPLVAQPGTKWSYSASLDLLGRVIEVVSGQPFDAFLKARMFDPLGMDSTSFVVSDANAGRLSTSYAPIGGSLFPVDPASTSIYRDVPSFPFGGAGLVCSARDYDKFLAMLLGEGALGSTRIMSTATAQLALSNIMPAGATTEGTFAAGQGFGAGGRVSLPGSREGEGVFGWGGAAGTIGFVDRRRRVRFGGYANYFPPEVYDFQRRVGEVMYSDLAAMAAAPAGR